MPLKTYSFNTSFQYYGKLEKNPIESARKFAPILKKMLEKRIPEDLDASIKNIEVNQDYSYKIILEGNDIEELKFVSKILSDLVGASRQVKYLHKGDHLTGFLNDVGKVGFGIFVEAGITQPEKEILIPLHNLRNQLANDKKIPVNKIIELFGFMDHLPVQIEITKIEFDKGGKPRIEAKFTEDYLEKWIEWVEDGLEILFSVGVPRQSVKKTLAKRGHTIDIIEIERLGPLENAIFCKPGTHPKGLIKHIGSYLPNCIFSTVKPRKIQKLWNTNKES